MTPSHWPRRSSPRLSITILSDVLYPDCYGSHVTVTKPNMFIELSQVNGPQHKHSSLYWSYFIFVLLNYYACCQLKYRRLLTLYPRNDLIRGQTNI